MEKINEMVLFNDDCINVMNNMHDKSIDFILTDIPYELDWNGGVPKGEFGTRKLYGKKGQNNIIYDFSNGIDYEKIFNEFIRILKVVNVCIFCSNKQVGKIMTWWENKGYVATLLVWDKPNPAPFGNHVYLNNLEFIVYVRAKGATFNNLGYEQQMKSFHYSVPSSNERIHETEKPIELLAHLLRIHTKEKDIVFDPYGGSFSTAIACYELNREFIGCEIDKEYFDKAIERLRNKTIQGKLF